MTTEQIGRICDMAILDANAVPYGAPVLRDRKWVIGFKRRQRDEMALQVEFLDREIGGDSEQTAATLELTQRIRGALLLSW